MTATKLRILVLIVFMAIYIPTVFFVPVYILNFIFWPIAGWHIGGWVGDLSNKLAVKFGYVD